MKPWTPEEDNLITARWAEGVSYSQIAVDLVAVGFAKRSRNAVIGRASRLGLRRQPQPVAAIACIPPAPRPKPVRIIPAPAKPRLPPARPAAEEPRPVIRAPDRPGVSLRELDALFNLCRWPLWPDADWPTSEEMKFCGAPALPAGSYCPHHCTVAYRPAGERRRSA